MRHVSRCLNSKLVSIHQGMLQLETIQLLLKAFLPEDIREHCHAGSLNKGCLTLVVDNAAWSHQLRYLLPELRDKLRSEAGLYQLISIKLMLAPNDDVQKTQSVKHRELSSKVRHMILKQSKDCAYLPLKKALEDLAKD